MIRDRNIICIASNWFYDPTSKHHVMRLLARDNHVVWVNHHGSRRPRLNGTDVRAGIAKLRQFAAGPVRVSESMSVVTPWVVPLPGRRAATAVNRRLLTAQIRSVLDGLPRRPVQLWSFAPDVDYLCGRFDEECVVYYCVDEFGAFSGYDRDAIEAAEARLARAADVVITTSQALFQSKRRFNDRTALVTHGVDYEHFARATDDHTPVPHDVAGLPRPVLGFWGLIQDWIDVDLLAGVAASRPDWSVVLIGEPATDVSALARLPNVRLLGRRPYADLPAYARAFDVGLLPFRVNDLTRAVNPIKLREYLSAGLPVVSTPLPEAARFGELVSIEDGPEAFAAACGRALEQRTPADAARRQAAMRCETWAAKTNVILRHVGDALAARRQNGTPHIDPLGRRPDPDDRKPNSRYRNAPNSGLDFAPVGARIGDKPGTSH